MTAEEETRPQYVARLCWNSKNWIYPTGEAAKTEWKTYATRTGYGHEEWLFNFQWILDGWKYGFLQPVNRSYERVCGKTLGVRLYTISSTGEWFYIAEIPVCEVITPEQAEEVRTVFRKRGWAKDMEEQAERFDGNLKALQHDDPLLLFNIRFRPGSIDLYDPMIPIPRTDVVRKLRRYTLVELKGKLKTVEAEWRGRKGTLEVSTAGKQRRRAVGETVVDPVHDQLKEELFSILRARFGTAVIMERDFVDVRVTHGSVVHLFEVKSDPRPMKALRESVGQLLEYAFICERKGLKVESLVVAAPGELDGLAHDYLKHLRSRRHLPLQYLCLRRS